MTAVTPGTDLGRPGTRPAGTVPWRPLITAAVRLHRAALTAYLLIAVLTAAAMLATGLVLHGSGSSVFSAGPHSLWPLFNVTFTTLRLVLPLLPVVAGLFLGAPLVARELETGTARFAWTQGAGRLRWLTAQIVPVTLVTVVVAAGLGLEFRWWAGPLLGPGWSWNADVFGLNPLPYVGWMLLGVCLAVLAGAAVRRTVPAMAATLACFLPLLYLVALTRLRDYLPPLRRAVRVTFAHGGGYSYSLSYGPGQNPGPDIVGRALGWPDGRLLSQAQLGQPAEWLSQHHIRLWLSYQPASRFGLFELIEFGWLAVASALLIAATIVLIRRRPG